jgi:hypothetical protein
MTVVWDFEECPCGCGLPKLDVGALWVVHFRVEGLEVFRYKKFVAAVRRVK